MRKTLQEKRRLDVVSRLSRKETKRAMRDLHVISKEAVKYALQFPFP